MVLPDDAVVSAQEAGRVSPSAYFYGPSNDGRWSVVCAVCGMGGHCGEEHLARGRVLVQWRGPVPLANCCTPFEVHAGQIMHQAKTELATQDPTRLSQVHWITRAAGSQARGVRVDGPSNGGGEWSGNDASEEGSGVRRRATVETAAALVGMGEGSIG